MCEKSTKFARGTVWWVRTQIDSMCSTSQKGTRPFLIISNNEYNIKFGKATCIPLSHQDKYETFGTMLSTIFEGKKSYILVDQIRQIEYKHFSEYLFTLNPSIMKDVDKYIIEYYTNIGKSFIEDTAPVESTEVATDNVFVDNNIISNVEYRISAIESDYNRLSCTINEQSTEIIRLAKALNNVNNDFNKMVNSSITLSTEIKDNKVNLVTKKSETNKKINNKSNKSKSSMPYGYFNNLENNITFWEELITCGKEYVMKKYHLKNDAQFHRRKSRVKIFLEIHNYDIHKI
jgi:mRNA-degrading endonuclease toxin of MazEF toxin-antitoxin module